MKREIIERIAAIISSIVEEVLNNNESVVPKATPKTPQNLTKIIDKTKKRLRCSLFFVLIELHSYTS